VSIYNSDNKMDSCMHKVPDSEQYIQLLVKSLAADYEEEDNNGKVEKQVIQFIKKK